MQPLLQRSERVEQRDVGVEIHDRIGAKRKKMAQHCALHGSAGFDQVVQEQPAPHVGNPKRFDVEHPVEAGERGTAGKAGRRAIDQHRPQRPVRMRRAQRLRQDAGARQIAERKAGESDDVHAGPSSSGARQ